MVRDDLFIRQRGLRRDVPINHPATAIDQAFAIKIDKNSQDGADVIVIKGIALP